MTKSQVGELCFLLDTRQEAERSRMVQEVVLQQYKPQMKAASRQFRSGLATGPSKESPRSGAGESGDG
jgi:hypothetical protein